MWGQLKIWYFKLRLESFEVTKEPQPAWIILSLCYPIIIALISRNTESLIDNYVSKRKIRNFCRIETVYQLKNACLCNIRNFVSSCIHSSTISIHSHHLIYFLVISSQEMRMHNFFEGQNTKDVITNVFCLSKRKIK